MPEPTIPVTRDELYQLVWSTPITVLAQRYGISDVGVAKICARLHVPRPGRGHWSKVSHGEVIPTPPLPPLPENAPAKAEVSPTPPSRKRAKLPTSDATAVEVKSSLEGAHPIVRKIRALLQDREPDKYGMAWLRGNWRGAMIRVSNGSKDRALRILDALFKHLETRGHAIRFVAPGRPYEEHKLEVVKGDESISICLAERSTQRPHKLTRQEEAEKRRLGRVSLLVDRHDYDPSGELTLRLGPIYGVVVKTTWTDGGTPVEKRLGEIVAAIEQGFVGLAKYRQQREAERRAEEQARRQRALEEKRARHHEALAEDLEQMAEAWSTAKNVRAFLDEVERHFPIEDRSTGFAAWLAWARDYITALDPLCAPERIAKVVEPAGNDEKEGDAGSRFPY
jgi:hypothetical protein